MNGITRRGTLASAGGLGLLALAGSARAQPASGNPIRLGFNMLGGRPVALFGF